MAENILFDDLEDAKIQETLFNVYINYIVTTIVVNDLVEQV